MPYTLCTIGYEGSSLSDFLDALREAGVELLVDVRAVASSRRPGFSKNSLAANLAESGIDYLQLRGLGTPADGRAAARAGRYDELETIYAEHLRTLFDSGVRRCGLNAERPGLSTASFRAPAPPPKAAAEASLRAAAAVPTTSCYGPVGG